VLPNFCIYSDGVEYGLNDLVLFGLVAVKRFKRSIRLREKSIDILREG
jgi:hypothetical protein